MAKKITHQRKGINGITHLEVDDVEKTRKQVYDDILSNDYYTSVNGKIGSKVHRVKTWLSTNPNESIGDNLGELPLF